MSLVDVMLSLVLDLTKRYSYTVFTQFCSWSECARGETRISVFPMKTPNTGIFKSPVTIYHHLLSTSCLLRASLQTRHPKADLSYCIRDSSHRTTASWQDTKRNQTSLVVVSKASRVDCAGRLPRLDSSQSTDCRA
jgi:hypothetical protein